MTSVPSTTICALTTPKSKPLLQTSLFSCGLAHTFVTSNWTFYLDSPKFKIPNMKFFTSSHIKSLYHAAFLILDNDTTIHAWNVGVIAFSLLHSSEIPTDGIFFFFLHISRFLSFPWSLSLPLFRHFSTWTISAASRIFPCYHRLSISFLLLPLGLHVAFRVIFLNCRYHLLWPDIYSSSSTGLSLPHQLFMIINSKGFQNP